MADTPVSKRRLKRATTRRLLIYGGAGIGALIVAGAAYFGLSSLMTKQAEQEEAALEAGARQLANDIGGVFGGLSLKLGVIADRREVAEALRAGDGAALQRLASTAAGGIDHLLRLRLLPENTSETDDSEEPPLTYASLDMLNRGRTMSSVPAELHRVGSEQAHIVILRGIRAEDGDLLGFVHASFSPDLLRAQLDSAAAEGYVEVTQPVPRARPVVLARFGGARPPQGTPLATARIPGTTWTLAFAGEPGEAAREEVETTGGLGALMAPILGVVLVLAAAAGGLVFWRRRREGLAGEAVVFQGALRAIMDGAHPGLERLVPGIAATAGGPADAPAAIHDELDGDDITHFTKPPGMDEAVAAAKAAKAAEDAKAAGTAEPDAAAVGPPGGEPLFSVDGVGIEVSEEEIDPEALAAAGITIDEAAAEAPAEEPASPPAPEAPAEPAAVVEATGTIPPGIFRTYDIRGIVGESLTADIVHQIGLALGSEALERGQQGIVVARDGRVSSPELAEALINGLLESGRDVIDIGCVPTPVLYFATHYLDTGSGVMVTGSHNPGNYNGMKIVLDGETLSGEAITAIRTRIEAGDFASGAGNLQSAEMIAEYIRRISEDVPVALGNALKVVVDCGNGVPGVVAPQLLRALGHDVVELYCEVDGDFPNHHPDPSQPDNLQDLIDLVSLENADLGLAFDGDGDRLGVIDPAGNIIWPDRQMILFARDVLTRNPGAEIIFDVKCSRLLPAAITEAGGQATMWRTGHSLIKSRMQESGALLAGEMSGHIFFKERWYGFDDALYSAARLLEILCNADESPADVFAALPDAAATPELRIDLPETEHAAVMQRLLDAAAFDDGETTTIDGLRVDFADGWGLIRPSNTTPCLVCRFEGDDADALARVQERFREFVSAAAPELSLPF